MCAANTLPVQSFALQATEPVLQLHSCTEPFAVCFSGAEASSEASAGAVAQAAALLKQFEADARSNPSLAALVAKVSAC